MSPSADPYAFLSALGGLCLIPVSAMAVWNYFKSMWTV